MQELVKDQTKGTDTLKVDASRVYFKQEIQPDIYCDEVESLK